MNYFHATSNDYVTSIMVQGFNKRGGMWGKGVYFSDSLQLSEEFAERDLKNNYSIMEVEIEDSNFGKISNIGDLRNFQKKYGENITMWNDIDFINDGISGMVIQLPSMSVNEVVVFDSKVIDKNSIRVVKEV